MTEIHAIRPEDFSGFQKLHYATFGHAPSVPQIKSHLFTGEIFVAKDPNAVIGFVTSVIENSGIPIITWIAVQESARGIGIGRRLLGEMEKAYPERGLVDVPSEFQEAIGFFLCCGFHLFAQDKNHSILRRDLKVDSPTLERLESIFGKATKKSKRRKGK